MGKQHSRQSGCGDDVLLATDISLVVEGCRWREVESGAPAVTEPLAAV